MSRIIEVFLALINLLNCTHLLGISVLASRQMWGMPSPGPEANSSKQQVWLLSQPLLNCLCLL